MDIVARGEEDLYLLARRLKDAGRNDLKKELLRGIRESNKATISAIRRNAEATLPSRGGLASLVAKSRIGTRTRLSANRVGVQIKGTGSIGLASINEGRLRHPVFGNRKAFVSQTVESGWFDEPIEHDLPQIVAGINKAMARVRDNIERGL